MHSYKSVYATGVAEVIKRFTGDICDARIRVVGEYTVPQVCRPLTLTIFSLLNTCYYQLQHRKVSEFGIILRSLADYFISLLFLSALQEPMYARLFVGYEMLVRYWQSKTAQTELGRRGREDAAKQFREYISSEFDNLVPKKKNLSLNGDWSKIEEYIERRYRNNGWTGLAFADRVSRIRAKAEGQFMMLQLKNIEKLYTFYSNWTHATAYGLELHAASRDLGVDSPFANDGFLRELERFLYVFLLDTGKAFSQSLMEPSQSAMLGNFDTHLQVAADALMDFKSLVEKGE